MTDVLFMGRKRYGAEALRWTIGLDHRVVGVLTDHHVEDSATAAVAREHGVPLLDYEQACRAVRRGELVFDIAVCFVYWRYIRAPLLTHPPLGIVNLHPAPLPELKGTGGYNIAILEDFASFGVTMHYMDATIDTGEIIEVRAVELDPERETAASLERRSMRAMLELYRDRMPALLAGERPLTLPNVGGRYVSRDQMNALKRVRPGDDVERKARAFWFPPATGACIEVDGATHTIVPRLVLDELGANPDGYLWNGRDG